ncbi:3-dehydroquinate dehydratase, type I [Exophiala spinifera]|uniref:3-dehydroquinate dehydratase, type I n=1 Tax=Exophiala spinifera TaxID=91928 RepID=A0A0D1YHT1_9EURO|nr:3-dehydroquinate dehydratase, type I [Exophiala spinifera]KIW14471.1 3-dehydroquinate dehydratase, type I [Exophiala spinifera]
MKRKLSFTDSINSLEAAKESFSDPDNSTPKSTWTWPTRRRYDQDASIVFIGPRATGTSSLAVIAASIQGWKVIDCDRRFEEVTGSTKQQYHSAHGVESYRRRKLEVVREALESNTKNCVFACGTIAAREKTDFFMRYARHHPVVYVMREQKLIQDYLGLADDEGWKSALDHMHSFFRQRSNIEFFNLDEGQEPLWQTTLTLFLEKKRFPGSGQLVCPLILRKTCAHVSLLLQNVFGPLSPTNYQGSSQVIPPSDIEWRRGSHVLRVGLDDVKRGVDHIHALDSDHDAVQLCVAPRDHEWQSLLLQDTLAWAVATLRRYLDVPVIVDISRPAVSTKPSPGAYLNMLRLALRLAPEYLTIDLGAEDNNIKEITQAKSFTKIIGCYHQEHPEDDFWNSAVLIRVYHRARDLGCDVVSISCPCQSFNDNIKCRQVSETIARLGLQTPIITFNTGSLGRLSQVLNDCMTPVIDENQGKNEKFGLTSSRQLRAIWHGLVPDSRPMYYVFGAEVKQSLSPAMHNAGFSFSGLPYTHQACETVQVGVVGQICSQESFGGASISLPFKSEVLALAARQSTAVKLIGAANTLIPDRSASRPQNSHQVRLDNTHAKIQLMAENTDWIGIYVCIAKHCTPANHITKHTSALVIGAGGIARAAIYALVRLGVGNIFILNRTISNACKVKEHFESIGDDLERSDRHSSPAVPSFHVFRSPTEPWPEGANLPSVVICAIPVRADEGTTEYPSELRDDWFGSATGGLIADLSWKRRATTLGEQLREAKFRGWARIDPIEILYEQGCAQFELFTNKKAPRKAMLDAFLEQYNATYTV